MTRVLCPAAPAPSPSTPTTSSSHEPLCNPTTLQGFPWWKNLRELIFYQEDGPPGTRQDAIQWMSPLSPPPPPPMSPCAIPPGTPRVLQPSRADARTCRRYRMHGHQQRVVFCMMADGYKIPSYNYDIGQPWGQMHRSLLGVPISSQSAFYLHSCALFSLVNMWLCYVKLLVL